MSITEQGPTPKNPIEAEVGLSPEDNQKAVDLRDDLYNATSRRRDVHEEGFKDYSRSFGREMIELGQAIKANRDVKVAKKASKAHYQKNAGEYQAQAVKDAAAENVHTNFGT